MTENKLIRSNNKRNKMTWEEFASEGVIVKPQIFTLYGVNGVGKTTLAAAFGNAEIVDLEDGSRNIEGVKRYPKKAFPSFQVLKDFLFSRLTSKETKSTLIIDSLEALEDMISEFVCKEADVDSIEKAFGGFGKGVHRMREYVGDMMRMLQMIRDEKDMNIVIVAHAQIKAFTDPTSNQAYDRITLRSTDKFAAVVKDLSDTVLFLKPKVYTEASKTNKNKAIASSADERVIYTKWSAAFDAKTRYSLPAEIVYTLDTIQDAVSILKGNELDLLREEIEGLFPAIKDKAKLDAANKRINEAGNDIQKLRVIRDRLKELSQETT